jgi:AraC-like DNA-binding protein
MTDRIPPLPSAPPTPPLRPFITRYMDVEVDVPAGQWLVQRVSPPGGATLSIRWSGEVALLDTDPPVLPPALALTGPITLGGLTACAGSLRMFGIFFTAAGAHDLFGLGMPQFVNRSVPAEPALGEWVRTLADEVAAAATAAERRARVEASLRHWLENRNVVPGLGARAAALVWARAGAGPIADLPGALGVSERTLRRHFLREVGVPLKAYARWARFARAHEFLARSARRSWVEASHCFGFADQAHLVREYRHFAGQPPSHLRASERLYDPVFVPDSGGIPHPVAVGRFLQDNGAPGA